MSDSNLYSELAARTGGAIMLGVVGPVRTGKSSFIKRFMETLVIPRIENDYLRERARDELPQSASGKTIMTAEPKFVPENAVSIRLGGDIVKSGWQLCSREYYRAGIEEIRRTDTVKKLLIFLSQILKSAS